METYSINTCQPIERLVNLLEENGFRIIEKEVSDYHFNELKIKMKGGTDKCLEKIEIEGITKHDNQFFCSCHWSTVEIEKLNCLPANTPACVIAK